MSTLILFYSHSGKTRALATQRAQERGADLEEVFKSRKFTAPGVIFRGIILSIRRKAPEIQPIKADLSKYDTISIWSPVWASHPAPVFNSIVERLPSGRQVELNLTSSSGKSAESAEGTKALIQARGCTVTAYNDIKSSN